MIYTTGTVNTVSGSAIVKGTGTKFKNNNPAINIGMTILIKSGNTNIPYMIKSVNSDTELVLAQPALATATNTTFSIHITEPDNNSDAARTMVAINAYTQYFLDAMNTWMTQTEQTKIEMPNGEVITFDSIKKMQEDIGKKFDKSGGELSGKVILNHDWDVITIKATNDNLGGYIDFRNRIGGRLGVIGFDTPNIENFVINNTKLKTIFEIGDNQVFINSIALLKTGDGGINSESLVRDVQPDFLNIRKCGLFSISPKITTNIDSRVSADGYCSVLNTSWDTINRQLLVLPNYGNKFAQVVRFSDKSAISVVDVMTSNMWTTDSNGFYKRASPVININPDGTFTTNDESEGATVTRVAQGEYLIEGVLGFNSDAGWGGVDGGIEIPLDVNKQPLIWVDSKVMEEGSILVRTYHRTHPNAPKFARNDIDGYKDGDPIDIPTGRFISVRVQMPEQSIYNVRMREMEEEQREEEEHRQKEED
ncbi:phage tail fiber protein [Proteus terrae]|uniref:phage tail fiber protein n=1 Tax=Proteus terrae TaxID=1574161 RepID=UPI001C5D3D12|nr:hypothetical protein [Proteus terrae]